MQKAKKTNETIQAFPLTEDNVNLTSGSGLTCEIIHCVEDGTITITWASGETDDIDMVAGDDFTIPYDATIEISSGTFHLA